jgi:hypothetical protein
MPLTSLAACHEMLEHSCDLRVRDVIIFVCCISLIIIAAPLHGLSFISSFARRNNSARRPPLFFFDGICGLPTFA